MNSLIMGCLKLITKAKKKKKFACPHIIIVRN